MKICIIYPYKNTTKKNLIFTAEFVFYEALLILHCTTAIEMQTIQKTVKNTNKKIFQLIYNKQNHTKKKKPEYDDAKRNHKQSLKAKK